MTLKHADDIPAAPVQAGACTTIQVLIPPQEGPNFVLRRFTMKPGGGMPLHTNRVEHEQYVLAGRARIGVGDEVYEVRAGDVLLIPAGVPHYYENIGQEDFVFLCIVPNQEDEIKLLNC